MACYLTKTDPSKNQHRFYALHIMPDLFGNWSLVRSWGRIGTSGSSRTDSFDSEEAAQDKLKALQRQKVRKGYQLLTPTQDTIEAMESARQGKLITAGSPNQLIASLNAAC